ncbi:MAG: carboxypeptidase regulatory-like domain-containing protein [Planctomycetota bacterium]
MVNHDNRGVRYAIVHLSGNGLSGWRSQAGYLLLDNKSCRFEPHAAVLTVGSTLEVKNSDKILHTAHAYFGATFNLALPAEGITVKRVLRRAGIVQIRCDNHGWMNAFIRVDRHPFHAVTDSDGRFKIEGVPPGTYTLEWWHERSGPKKQEISVSDQRTTRVELTFAE